MIEIFTRGVLLDIEGTTSSIRFVYDVMFPHVREHLESFLVEHWESGEVQQALEMLALDLNRPSAAVWLGDQPLRDQQQLAIRAVIALMDADRKATGLKQLQGLIWKDGFHGGQLVAHVYDDVPPAIKEWVDSGIDVRIYSSGSIAAQQLFFGHTIAGNLLALFRGHYDTTTGPKKEPGSYLAIANEFELPPSDILFISDSLDELRAADEAGLQVLLSVRPENPPIESDHPFPSVRGFDQVQITAGVGPATTPDAS